MGKTTELVNSLMKASGYYVFSLASTFTKDKKKIYKIANETYKEMFTNSIFIKDEDSFVTYITKTVNEKAKLILKKSIKFKKIENINFDVDLKDLDMSKIEKTFDNPKSQNIIYDTIGNLSDEQKEVIFRVYFCNEPIEQIAKEYNVTNEVINDYLSSSHKEIDKNTKNYILKNKILDSDYSGMLLIYSGIKLSKTIVSSNLANLLIDSAMDMTVSKVFEKGIDKILDEDKNSEEENNKTSIENLISTILKDIFNNWINDGIKGAVRLGIVKAKAAITSETISSTAKGVATVGTKSFFKTTFGKVVVTLLSCAVVGTSGVKIGKVVQEKHYAEKKQEILSEEPFTTATGNFSYLANTGVTSYIPFSVSFYSDDDNSNEVEFISINFTFKQSFMDEAELKTYEFALSLIDGLDASYENSNDTILFNAIIEKDDLNYKLIDFLTKNTTINENDKALINDIINSDCDNLIECLESYGYKCS